MTVQGIILQRLNALLAEHGGDPVDETTMVTPLNARVWQHLVAHEERGPPGERIIKDTYAFIYLDSSRSKGHVTLQQVDEAVRTRLAEKVKV